MPEPAISIAAAKVSKGDNLPPTRVVIHTTSPPKVPFPTASEAGKATSTANFFKGPGAGLQEVRPHRSREGLPDRQVHRVRQRRDGRGSGRKRFGNRGEVAANGSGRHRPGRQRVSPDGRGLRLRQAWSCLCLRRRSLL